MGFFGELKQDLSQVAGDELKREQADAEAERILAGAQLAGLDEAESVKHSLSADNDSIDDNDDVAALLKDLVAGLAADDIPLAEENKAVPQTESHPVEEVTVAEEPVAGDVSEEVKADIDASALFTETEINAGAFSNGVFNMGDGTCSEETSVITEGMVINGNVESEGNLELKGRINGDITVRGKLNVTGYITGNSIAGEVYAENAKITGNVNSESLVKIGTGTVIVGNISSFSAAIAGAVKGDIDVHGPVVLDSTAIVKGNIRSKSVQISNGAVLEGVCSQAYAEVSPTSFFEDYKPEEGD